MKPFDISKFRKDLTKSIPGVSVGFHDPKTWIDSGNYALNYLISGDFKKGVPLGKVTMFAGQPGSGKSYVCSGNIIRNAQNQNIFPILIDTENALDEKWLKPLGVATSEEKLLKVNMSMIDDVAKLISDFMKDYKLKYEKVEPEDRPKVLFVLDSIGMLLTPTDVAQFEAGELKGDLGRKPKALTALVRNCVNMFGEYDVGLVVTNHTYASQDMFNPDEVVSGGCLIANTLVAVNDSFKNIQDIVVGDIVETLEGPQKVEKTFQFNKPVITLELEDGTCITATTEHKFLVKDFRQNYIWKTVEELNEGDGIIKWMEHNYWGKQWFKYLFLVCLCL